MQPIRYRPSTVRPLATVVVALALSLAAAGAAGAARADDDEAPPPPVKTLHPVGWGIQISLSGGYLAQPPGITNFRTPSNFSYRGLEGTTVLPDSGAALIAIEAGLSYQLPTLLSIPLVGLRGALPIGGWTDRTFPSTPEPTQLHLISDSFIEALGPGLGLHAEVGNVLLTASAQPLLEIYHARGTLTQGMLTTDIGGYGYSLGVDGDASVCLQGSFISESFRGDSAWGCLYAAPFLLRAGGGEPTFWNGMLVGVRLFATSRKF